MAAARALCAAFLISFIALTLQQDLSLSDFEAIISNSRIVKHTLNCVIDKGPCTKDARNLKKVLKNVITTSCAKCPEDDKRKFATLMRRVNKDRTLMGYWGQVLHKYDPGRQHREGLEQLMQQY